MLRCIKPICRVWWSSSPSTKYVPIRTQYFYPVILMWLIDVFFFFYLKTDSTNQRADLWLVHQSEAFLSEPRFWQDETLNTDWSMVLAEDFPAAAKFCYQLNQTIDAKRKQMVADIPVWTFNKAKSRNNKRAKVRKKQKSVENCTIDPEIGIYFEITIYLFSGNMPVCFTIWINCVFAVTAQYWENRIWWGLCVKMNNTHVT